MPGMPFMFIGFLAVLLPLLFVAGVVALGVAGSRAMRSSRRRVEAWQTSARAVIPGPAQAVYAMRERVRRELTSARDALGAARAAGRPTGAFEPSLARLVQTANQLDLDLAIIAGEPDHRAREALLAEQRERLEQFARACHQVRRGAVLAGGPDADGTLARTATELAEEVERLRLRAQAFRDLSGPGPGGYPPVRGHTGGPYPPARRDPAA